MRLEWHAAWGSARGPATRLAPEVRLVCAACAFSICMVVPVTTPVGIGVVASTVLLWWALCRPEARLVRMAVLLALALFLPYLLLVPVISAGTPGQPWTASTKAPWTVVVRGFSTLQVVAAAVSSLSVSALRQGLIRLPVPAAVAAVVLQIVHQTSTLVSETRRIAAAIAIRGGTGHSRTAVRVLASVSLVWLPRVAARAERVGAAMEVRGYCQSDPRINGTAARVSSDVLAVFLALLALGGAIALRLWGAR